MPPQTVACPHLGAWMARVLGPQQPGHPAVHQHRPAARRRRRAGRAEGVHHRPASSAASSARSTCRIPTRRPQSVRPPQGHDARPLRQPLQAAIEKLRRTLARTREYRQRLSAASRCSASLDNAHRLLSCQGARRVRPLAGAEGELREVQHRPLRPRLPAGPPAGRSRGPVHRGDHRVRAVPPLGHARERPHDGRAR